MLNIILFLLSIIYSVLLVLYLRGKFKPDKFMIICLFLITIISFLSNAIDSTDIEIIIHETK